MYSEITQNTLSLRITLENLMIIFISEILELMILESQRFVLKQMMRVSLRLSMSLAEQHQIISIVL